jgi:hypothetical protein
MFKKICYPTTLMSGRFHYANELSLSMKRFQQQQLLKVTCFHYSDIIANNNRSKR